MIAVRMCVVVVVVVVGLLIWIVSGSIFIIRGIEGKNISHGKMDLIYCFFNLIFQLNFSSP